MTPSEKAVREADIIQALDEYKRLLKIDECNFWIDSQIENLHSMFRDINIVMVTMERAKRETAEDLEAKAHKYAE